MKEWLLTSSSYAAFSALVLLGLIPSTAMTLLLNKLCQGRWLISLLCFFALFKALSLFLIKHFGAVETWDNSTALRIYLFGFSFLLGPAVAFIISAVWSQYELSSSGPNRDRVPIRHDSVRYHPYDEDLDQETDLLDPEARQPRQIWTLDER